MLPVVSNRVRPWFETYGTTLNDKASFRVMIEMAERDITSLKLLLPEYQRVSPDVYAESVEEIFYADQLVEKMRARLAELEAA